MARTAAAVLFVQGAALVAAQGATTSCAYSVPGASWDLSSMNLAALGGLYQYADMRDPSIVYFFNVCGDIKPPTQYSSNCAWNNQNTSLAWQVDTPDPLDPNVNCYSVGGTAAGGWNFTLLDPTRPASGVSLIYPGGQSKWCPGNKARSFTLQLQCAPGLPLPTAGASASVFETNACDYSMQLKSIAGCPTACVTGSSICNGNGVCGWNTDAQRAQCFCNTGFSGSSCGDASSGGSSGMSTEGILLIVVCIALAGVLGLVVFMFTKLRKLQVDPAAYGQLEGKFNELGMLA